MGQPGCYQEMQALGVSTAEGVTNFELQKPRQGSVRSMEKKSSLFFFFFLLWQDMSIETMPFKTKPIKCKDHIRCEKLEAFQHNKDFLKIFCF